MKRIEYWISSFQNFNKLSFISLEHITTKDWNKKNSIIQTSTSRTSRHWLAPALLNLSSRCHKKYGSMRLNMCGLGHTMGFPCYLWVLKNLRSCIVSLRLKRQGCLKWLIKEQFFTLASIWYPSPFDIFMWRHGFHS